VKVNQPARNDGKTVVFIKSNSRGFTDHAGLLVYCGEKSASADFPGLRFGIMANKYCTDRFTKNCLVDIALDGELDARHSMLTIDREKLLGASAVQSGLPPYTPTIIDPRNRWLVFRIYVDTSLACFSIASR
jgi:hypothetical protein